MPLITGHNKKNRHYKKIKGFTLIEMAIVLVIIGLITGGILVGQTLIRQSQINSAMTDAQLYISAAKNFQQQYASLPGDMANATTYWGAMGTCPPAAGSASAGGTLTCNGDGNGQIFSYAIGSANEYEALLFWQHLANAQLIQGSYTGIAGSGSAIQHIIGKNSPGGRLSGLGFAIMYLGFENQTNENYFFTGNYGHVITLGAYLSANAPWNPILTTSEAQSFDNKFDDGAPATGIVRTFTHGNGVFSPYCATTNVATTALYNTSSANANSSGFQCSLILVTGF